MPANGTWLLGGQCRKPIQRQLQGKETCVACWQPDPGCAATNSCRSSAEAPCITYRARDTTLGRDVAIKEYLPTLLALREGDTMVMPLSTALAEEFVWGRDRFLEEARTLATLGRAPAVARIYDFLEANGTAYIVMELAMGETLEHRIAQDGPLAPPAIERLLSPLLDGLEQVHDVGFLHRDIKPANIILDASGNPTLIDFGAARAALAGRTTAMTTIFTPGYAAGEQFTSA